MKNSILGLVLLAILIATRGSYRGMRAFYRKAQEKHPWAVGFLSGPLASLFLDYRFSKDNSSRARLSDRAIAQYSDDSLSGYADEIYDKGGDTLEAQQRGLILPLLYSLCGTVVEIGTGNGDVIARHASRYPDVKFIGIDFSVQTAERIHKLSNLTFIKGYALDVLPPCDVVFMSSTACVFTPLELSAYCDLFRSNAVKSVILNEPTWSGYEIDEREPYSNHLEGAVWFHNYPAYLRKAGYRIETMQLAPFASLRSPRPDIKVALIRAEYQG